MPKKASCAYTAFFAIVGLESFFPTSLRNFLKELDFLQEFRRLHQVIDNIKNSTLFRFR